jgi:aminoglycoside/choline kinase family phosphotransferase
LANDKLGVIDFQDAVKGPVIYDLVSLLKDCYVRWPKQLITPLMEDYRQQVQDYFPDENLSKKKWQYWFDLTGLQRHIKASGIFARLHHRDNKSGYLADIPLTLAYIQDVSAQYDKLNFLHELVTQRVMPAVNKHSGF